MAVILELVLVVAFPLGSTKDGALKRFRLARFDLCLPHRPGCVQPYGAFFRWKRVNELPRCWTSEMTTT